MHGKSVSKEPKTTAAECAAERQVREHAEGWRVEKRPEESWKYVLFVLETELLAPLHLAAAGPEHTLVVRKTARPAVFAFGSDDWKQLGLGDRWLRDKYERAQDTHKRDLAEMARVFRDEICPIFAPSLHRYFARRFAEPAAWLDARTRFARSHAAWCAVGHVVGLGDRHGENILVDEATGECVNVDFDCLFDKGLTLNKPEIVPFRLTQHVVDAFGVSAGGCDGRKQRR